MLEGRKRIWLMVLMLTILMVGSVSGSSVYNQAEKRICKLNFGNVLYVGGSGENNYTKIQDAIENASDGDTVYVYDDNSPYVESLIIDKSVNIIGENKYSTVIKSVQGGAYGCNIKIIADSVFMSGFTFFNSDGYYEYSIVKVISDECQISNIVFNSTKYCRGIYVLDGIRNNISGNVFYGNYNDGIFLEYANNTIILENVCEGNGSGITICDSNNCFVSSNSLLGSYYIGIFLRGNSNNVSYNCIYNSNGNQLAAGIKVVGESSIFKNSIYRNKIEDCENGIFATNYGSYLNENKISNCKTGIRTLSDGNIILKNDLSNNDIGLEIEYGYLNILSYNNINNNRKIGISLYDGFKNEILKNNIYMNRRDIQNLFCKRVRWHNNYWGNPMNHPKVILGIERFLLGYRHVGRGYYKEVYFYFPNIDIDLNPVQEPYDIGG